MDKPATYHLRDLMQRLQSLRSQHESQRSSPSRGYNEDAALEEMNNLRKEIEAEIEAIKSKIETAAEAFEKIELYCGQGDTGGARQIARKALVALRAGAKT